MEVILKDKIIRGCPEEGYEDAEWSVGQDMWGVTEISWVILPEDMEVVEKPHGGLQLTYKGSKDTDFCSLVTVTRPKEMAWSHVRWGSGWGLEKSSSAYVGQMFGLWSGAPQGGDSGLRRARVQGVFEIQSSCIEPRDGVSDACVFLPTWYILWFCAYIFSHLDLFQSRICTLKYRVFNKHVVLFFSRRIHSFMSVHHLVFHHKLLCCVLLKLIWSLRSCSLSFFFSIFFPNPTYTLNVAYWYYDDVILSN